MNLKSIATALIIALSLTKGFAQNPDQSPKVSLKDSVGDFKFSIHTTWLSFLNFGDEKTNTHHYELHLRYKLSQKDKIGIKIATWKLFAPMGMPMQEQLKFNESNFWIDPARNMVAVVMTNAFDTPRSGPFFDGIEEIVNNALAEEVQ